MIHLLRPPLLIALSLFATTAHAQSPSLVDVIDSVQPKIVKIRGAGGLKGLESYQTGILVSATGHVLTAWSYVLDSDRVTVTLSDGRRMAATLVGFDPQREVAVLKIEAQDLLFFNPAEGAELEVGAAALAFSNLYGTAVGEEGVSVQKGIVSGKTELAARRGAFAAAYRGPVYLLDAVTNNPGAAGGALTDRRGRLVGMLGKELKSSLDNTWLNYSLPLSEIAPAVDDILNGRLTAAPREPGDKKPKEHHTPAALGIAFLPDVLDKTPPFIDFIEPKSSAARGGLRPDDLVVFVNGKLTPSYKSVAEELSYIDRFDEVRLMVQRGGELIEVVVKSQE